MTQGHARRKARKMSRKVYPDPHVIYPMEGFTRLVYLKNIIHNPQIIVGEYTYYDDPEDVHNFEKNVLYLFDFIGDKLIIGKFCQIASGVRFIMNGSLHDMGAFPPIHSKSLAENGTLTIHTIPYSKAIHLSYLRGQT